MSAYSNILIESQYFPPISFFKPLMHCSSLLIEAKEHYQKGGFRNRCMIAGPNGVQRLTVPLKKGKNSKLPIRDVKIAYIDNWQKIHWQSIQTAYGKSPFFEYYQDDLRPLFEKKHAFLFDLNVQILEIMQDLLQISFDMQYTETYTLEAPLSSLDLRNQLSPKSLNNNQATNQKYPQVFESKNGFLSNLSILDLLFCIGPEAYYHLETQ